MTLAEVNAICARTNAALRIKRPERFGAKAGNPVCNTAQKAPPKAGGSLTLLQQYSKLKGEERFNFYCLHSRAIWSQFVDGMT